MAALIKVPITVLLKNLSLTVRDTCTGHRLGTFGLLLNPEWFPQSDFLIYEDWTQIGTDFWQLCTYVIVIRFLDIYVWQSHFKLPFILLAIDILHVELLQGSPFNVIKYWYMYQFTGRTSLLYIERIHNNILNQSWKTTWISSRKPMNELSKWKTNLRLQKKNSTEDFPVRFC